MAYFFKHVGQTGFTEGYYEKSYFNIWLILFFASTEHAKQIFWE